MYQPSQRMSGKSPATRRRGVEEGAVGRLDDVGLGHDRHPLLGVGPRELEGHADDALRSGVRDQAEVHVEVAQGESLAAQRVHVLRVLAKEHPVDAQARHADGADVGEEVQLLAHGDVGALDVGPLVALLGGGGGAFERDVVVADLGQHVVGDGLELGGAVLDREAVDGAELHLAGGQRRGEQFLEQALRLGGDRRADAVAADDADPDRLQRAEVGRGRGLPNLRHPIGLLRQDCAEALLGLGDAVERPPRCTPCCCGPRRSAPPELARVLPRWEPNGR